MSKRVGKDGVFLRLAGLLLGKHRPSLLFYSDQPNIFPQVLNSKKKLYTSY
jgi:hypothetical protein